MATAALETPADGIGSRSTAPARCKVEQPRIRVDLHRHEQVRVPHQLHRFPPRSSHLTQDRSVRMTESVNTCPRAFGILPVDLCRREESFNVRPLPARTRRPRLP